MTKFCGVGLTFVLCLAMAGPSWAADSVRTVQDTLTGRVTGMSPVKVDFELKGPGGQIKENREIPVNEVIFISYESEPTFLKNAKNLVLDRRFSDALTMLERVKEVARDEVKQDLEYYKALCAARLALGGRGKIAGAGRAMIAFINENPRSYHHYEGVEVIGDLLVAARQYPQAAEYYDRLAQAPWPEYKMRAGVATGRALLAQGKTDAAMKAFDQVLANDDGNALAESQRTLATLGKASVLVAKQDAAGAIEIAEAVIRKADPNDEPLQARAHNVLGAAYREAGRVKEALLAYLYVDQLCANIPDAHAEALANLAELWEKSHKMERAERARKTLLESYGDSPWAKKSGE